MVDMRDKDPTKRSIMVQKFDEISELSTNLLLVYTLIAAAWSDGVLVDKERDLIKKVIKGIRMSETRREMIMFETENQPDDDSVNKILEELCHRAKTKEMKNAILALVDMMITSDHEVDDEEIEFREKLEKTLRYEGKNFFQLIRDRFTLSSSG